jgi:hypothetical protein
MGWARKHQARALHWVHSMAIECSRNFNKTAAVYSGIANAGTLRNSDFSFKKLPIQ